MGSMSALSGTCSILKVPCYTDSPLYPRHFRKASSNSNHASRAPNLRTIVSARHPKRPRNSSDQLPVAQRTITKLVELPVIPIGSYISSHPSIIHRLDPRLKQAWLAALLLFPPNGTSEEKLLVCLFHPVNCSRASFSFVAPAADRSRQYCRITISLSFYRRGWGIACCTFS